MNQYLTLKDMEQICQQINEKFIPDDSNFMRAIEEQFEELGGASRDEFVKTAFHRMLQVLDSEIKSIEQNVNITASCTKGCSHCCYFPVILTKMEAKLIMQHIQGLPNEQKQQLLSHIENYFSEKHEEKIVKIDFQTDRDYKQNYINKQVPCPMLDLNTNSCKIYEVRPVQCRTHKIYSDPQVCADNTIPDEVFSYEFLYEYYIYALVNTVQEIIFENEGDPFNLPGDVYEANYLPKLIKELMIEQKGEM